jgi:hypothetical protein
MTAVEWLKEKMATSSPKEMVKNINVWFEEALKLEKQQIENAFNAGVSSEDYFYPSTGKLESEIYYEETYRK